MVRRYCRPATLAEKKLDRWTTRFLKQLSRKALRQTKSARRLERQEELNNKLYPSEIWFKDVLIKHGVKDWVQNLPVMCFFGDFGFSNCRLIIEIDGSWHNNKEAVQYDKRRDTLLKNHGWKVVRIKYPQEKELGYKLAKILVDLAPHCRDKKRIWAAFERCILSHKKETENCIK